MHTKYRATLQLLCCLGRQSTLCIVYNRYAKAIHICVQLVGGWFCTLSARRCCRCFVAWDVALHYIQCTNYSSCFSTCMCCELEGGMHTNCMAVLNFLCSLGFMV